jgi:hypothetical protein
LVFNDWKLRFRKVSFLVEQPAMISTTNKVTYIFKVFFNLK